MKFQVLVGRFGLGMQQVEVIRRDFTPRDSIQEGRFNVKLNLKAKVPEDSFLATASMPSKIEADDRVFKSAIGSVDEYLETENLQRLINRVGSIYRYRRYETNFPKYKDTYLIPGSSIKGAVRSRIEYKLKPIQKGGKLRSLSCYIVQNPIINPNFARRHLKFWGEDVSFPRSSCGAGKVCLVCDLFGNKNLSSRVHFSDAKMISGKVEYLPDLRIEAATPSSEFDLTVTCFNMNFLDLGLLLMGLEIFSGSPILIGMYKYRFVDQKYKNKFVFGKLKFELLEFKEMITDKLDKFTQKDLKEKCLEELKSLEFVDLDRGVIGY